MQITFDESRTIKAPTLDEFRFDATLSEFPVVISETGASFVDEQDSTFKRSTEAGVRYDAQIVTQWVAGPSQNIQFSSLTPASASVDDLGRITALANAPASILCKAGTLARALSYMARTEGGQTIEVWQGYRAGSLGLHMEEQIDAMVSAGGSLSLFSSVGATVSVRNPSSWIADLDWTGVAIRNSTSGGMQRGATAIASDAVLMAKHYPVSVGHTITWAAANGAHVERTLAAVRNIGETDIQIGRLSEALPDSIAKYKIMPNGWHGTYWFSHAVPARVPVLAINQYRQVLLRELTNVSASHLLSHVTYLASEERALYAGGLVPGDSGQPLFALVNGGLVILGSNGGSFTAESPTGHISAINAALSDMGSANTLQTADLSAFTNFA